MYYKTKLDIRNNNIVRECEALKDKTSLVDVSGYIPTAVQYERMRLAGLNKQLETNIRYNYDLQQMLDECGGIENFNLDTVSSLSLGHYKDPKDVANFVNDRMSILTKKYGTAIEQAQKLKAEAENIAMKNQMLSELVNEWKQNPEEFKRVLRTNNITLE